MVAQPSSQAGPAARVGQPAREKALLEDALALGRTGPPLLQRLLSLIGSNATVRFDPALDTAALRFEGDHFAILIGASAVERGTLTAPDLLYLLAHELCHLVRGEHRLSRDPRRAMAMNIAADAINDAWLTGPAFDGFFDPTTALPARRSVSHPLNGLMLPLPAARMLVERASPSPSASLVPLDDAQVSRRLYREVIPPVTGGLLPYQPDMWAATHRFLQEGGRDATLDAALGTELVLALLDQLPEPPSFHTTLLDALLQSEEGRALLEALRKLFAENPQTGTERGQRAGSGQPTADHHVRPARAEARLERFLRRVTFEVDALAGQWSPSGLAAIPHENGALVTARSALEYRAKLRATPMAERRPQGAEHPAGLELYLDASGSMHDDLPVLLASLVVRCPDLLPPRAMVFSVGVYPVTPRALRERRVPTDGGTSFAGLARDILRRRISTAVVISDGDAPPIDTHLMRELARRRVRVAMVFPRAMRPSPLDALCPPGWRLSLGLEREFRTGVW